MVLTFDDAPVSHYLNVAPLLKEHDFKATFFVCEFPPNFSDNSKYMNWEQIRQLDQMGFEIANHTKSHAHVEKITQEKLIEQLYYIESKCDSLGISKPTNFAYPGYGLNKSALEILKEKQYHFARAGGSRVYDPIEDHPFLIPSWATNEKNKKEILAGISQAKNGKIVVLTIHGVPDVEHPWVNTPIEIFKDYLNFLSKNNFKVISLKDLENYIDFEEALKIITPDFSKKLKN